MSTGEVRPWVRVVVLGIAVIALAIISWTTTGEIIPSDPTDALLLQSGILLVVLGSLILEKYFTAPGDALVNSFTAFITLLPLLPLLSSTSLWVWVAVVAYLGVVTIASAACLTLQSRAREARGGGVMEAAYLIASKFGRARVVFSVVFLACILFFSSGRSTLALALIVFWGLYLSIWPLGLPQLLSRITLRRGVEDQAVGRLDRIDSPNIARVALASSDAWPASPVVVHLPDGSNPWCIPLFRENRTDGVWGTFAITSRQSVTAGVTGHLVVPSGVVSPTRSELLAELAGEGAKEVAGLVRESSTLLNLRVEIVPEQRISSGQVLVVPTDGDLVYYQVTGAETSEESFGGLNYGSQIASAVQIGVLRAGRFERFDYLPLMNALVYLAKELPKPAAAVDDFLLGSVPGTGVSLYGDFLDKLESHTAILGTTGTGKTEFGFDLIRYAANNGVKVICIDLTSQYAPRLTDMAPEQLSISTQQAADLGQKLFDVDTGTYGAGAEKRVLATFASDLRKEVRASLERFYSVAGGKVGLIELTEISNTKATLWITEMYLSTLLELAKEGLTSGQKTLVVVEEAHTVMPEASFAGLGDFDSKGTIAKITQIALQGRKYGVGLLVLAQRTATVSKSVLTQCNTVISFSCIDDTSINFLRNVFGTKVAEGLSQLPRLRAVAHGSWIESELPIAFDVPFDSDKAKLSDWSAQLKVPAAVAIAQGTRSRWRVASR